MSQLRKRNWFIHFRSRGTAYEYGAHVQAIGHSGSCDMTTVSLTSNICCLECMQTSLVVVGHGRLASYGTFRSIPSTVNVTRDKLQDQRPLIGEWVSDNTVILLATLLTGCMVEMYVLRVRSYAKLSARKITRTVVRNQRNN